MSYPSSNRFRKKIEETKSDWPFNDPRNVATITTSKVLEGHPILLVTHDEDDGGWQFLCGTTNDSKDGRVVGLDRMYERDTSIGELADLPLGWRAWREAPELPWQREENNHEDGVKCSSI